MLSYILFAAPILLLVIVSTLIRTRGNPETAGRRYFLFLIWTAIGSLALMFLNWRFPRSVFVFVGTLYPILPGLVVLTLLHWHEWDSLHIRAKILILSAMGILLAAAILQFWLLSLKGDGRQLEAIFFGMALLSIAAFLFIALKWGMRYPLLLFAITALYLAFFLVFDLGSLSLPSESMPDWKNALGVLAYLAIPSTAIPVMATFTVGALNMPPASDETEQAAWNPILGRSLLIIILFGFLLYAYRWLWLWDGIDDGIRGLFMILVAAIAAISAGMVIGMTAAGWRRWMGLVFAISVTAPLYLVGITGFFPGKDVTNYTVTEERAARIQEAIQSYHAKTSWYPLHLKELVPGEMLRIPLPMIMPEQGWCYQGGSNYYRLGAVFREHWSSPYFSVRVYASAGNVPEEHWDCDEKLAEAISQSGYLTRPTPVPLPTSTVSVPRVVVEPILKASSFSMGNWSQDGSYLVFGLTEYFMDEVEHVTIDLRFLDAITGEICQPSQSKWTVKQSNGLRDHSAWLPDGRFLYVTDSGEMLAFTPCVGGVEDLGVRYSVKFTHVRSSNEQGERILLENREAYWLLDGSSLELKKIANIPTGIYWAWYDWSPDGERLAISQMSGPDIEDKASLYIVDWASGEVQKSMPLEGASDANPPIVEWLTRDELLIQGNKLIVMDLRSEPPATTDVLRDIFLLDIAYPLDIWGMDTVHSKDGDGYYIGLQVNHPHNKDAYVYSSKTGQVEIFSHDVSTLIFFEDGQWMRLLKWEDVPSYRDEYELVWMDQPDQQTRLKVEGHVPRANFQMIPGYLPRTSQLVFDSSQGISLLSIPDGKTTAFWELAGHADYFSVLPSPKGEALVIAADSDGLYYIRLSSRR